LLLARAVNTWPRLARACYDESLKRSDESTFRQRSRNGGVLASLYAKAFGQGKRSAGQGAFRTVRRENGPARPMSHIVVEWYGEAGD